MQADTAIRDELAFLLSRGNAHMSFSEAIADFPTTHMNTVFPNGTYTPWHLLEHIRLTQKDILDFMQNPSYKEPHWPDDYWPKKDTKATKKEWEDTITLFEKDNQALQSIIKDSKTDLYSKIPHGTGQTIIREVLVIADHNAYHLGEFAIMRQVMKTWKKK
jgi:Mn-containing catalase